MTINFDDNINDVCFQGFVDLVHELTGITIKLDRKTMLVGRLRRRINQLELPDYPAYLEYVRANTIEHEFFINQITTNETYFFRTPRVWSYLEEEFLPNWQEQHPKKLLNIWSAASSTGEEAHTLGILMQNFKESYPGFDYNIFARDIDTSVVKKAEESLYKRRSVERFRKARPDWFERYMQGNHQDGFTVLPSIKI